MFLLAQSTGHFIGHFVEQRFFSPNPPAILSATLSTNVSSRPIHRPFYRCVTTAGSVGILIRGQALLSPVATHMSNTKSEMTSPTQTSFTVDSNTTQVLQEVPISGPISKNEQKDKTEPVTNKYEEEPGCNCCGDNWLFD
jgi:hypothetical protein